MKARIVFEDNVSPYDKIGELILKKAKVKRVFKKKKEAGNQNAVKQVQEYAGQNRAIGFNYENQKKYTYSLSIKLDRTNLRKLKKIQDKFENFLERLEIDYFLEITSPPGNALIGFRAINNYESYAILDEIEKFLDTNYIDFVNAQFKDSTKPQDNQIKDFLLRQKEDTGYRVTNIGPRFQKYEHEIINLEQFTNINENDMKKVVNESLLENEYEGLPDYKEQVLRFIDHPWQEDIEIEFTSLLDQYRKEFLTSSSEFIKDYLQRMDKVNGYKLFNCTDAFLGAWDDLIK